MRVKALFALISVLTIVAFSLVYAVIIGTFRGGYVEVIGVRAGIAYSRDGITWTDLGENLQNIPLGEEWYVCLNTTEKGWHGTAIVSWVLLKDEVELHRLGGYTNVTLTGEPSQVIYCSIDGITSPGYNWGQHCLEPGMYLIEASITPEWIL